MTSKYAATLIGLMFSAASLLATVTFIIPFITVLPLSLILENAFKNGDNNRSYNEIGPSILNAMWIIFFVTSLLFYLYTIIKLRRGQPASTWLFTFFLILQLFIVHPLFFYIDTSQNWDRASDGQFILGIVETYPTSSFVFVVFGILLDLIRIVLKPKQEKVTLPADI